MYICKTLPLDVTLLTFSAAFHLRSTSSVDKSGDEWSLWAQQTLSII